VAVERQRITKGLSRGPSGQKGEALKQVRARIYEKSNARLTEWPTATNDDELPEVKIFSLYWSIIPRIAGGYSQASYSHLIP